MKKKITWHLLYITVIAIYIFIVGCPLKRITGWDCPLCGMTRAHIAFLQGDIRLALKNHSLFFLGSPLLLILVHMRIIKKSKKLYIVALIFAVIAILALMARYLIIIFKTI